MISRSRITPGLSGAMSALFTCLAASLVMGCAGLHVIPSRTSDVIWLGEGGGDARANHSHASLSPPLVQNWSARLEALPSPGGATVIGDHIFVTTRRGDLVVLDRLSGRSIGSTRLGQGFSGAPVIVDDLAVLTAGSEGGSVIGYDLRAGRVRWEIDAGPIEGSPALVDRRVIVASTNGAVTAVSMDRGRVDWTVTPDSTAGFFASPVVAGEHLIVADDSGGITALDALTGSVRWHVQGRAPSYVTPAYHGGRLFIPTSRGVVCSLEIALGEERWCHDLGDPLIRISGLAAGAGRIVTTSTDGMVRVLDAVSGELLWKADMGAALGAPPLMSGGVVYLGTLRGDFLALDLATGDELWRHQVPGRVHAAPIPAGDRILVLSAPRNLTAFRTTIAPPIE